MNRSVPPRPSPLRQLARRVMAQVLPRSRFMVSGPPGSRAVALTFDDGPHPEHTPAVLDRLRALGIRATFFVIGERAARHPALVERMVREGHEVGHHSWSHRPPAGTSARELVAEARRTAALLEPVLGRVPGLYRPPNGKLTPGKLLGLWNLGATVVLWNRDPKDYRFGTVEELGERLERDPLEAGDILLLHDVHPHVAPALDVLAARAARLGLGFCTPRDWTRG